LRARKPLLVFVEDVIPDNIVPARVLQSRFSRQSYFRQIRGHRHIVRLFKNYLGAPTRYQSPFSRRSSLIIGSNALPAEMQKTIHKAVEARHYRPVIWAQKSKNRRVAPILDELGDAHFALSFIDDAYRHFEYLRGAIWSAMVPTIAMTMAHSYDYDKLVPTEYQPRIIPPDQSMFMALFEREIDIFEQDFIDPDNAAQADTYTQLLADVASSDGRYSSEARSIIVKEVHIMGDTYHTGHAIAVGRGAQAHNSTMTVWQQISQATSLSAIAEELAQLRRKVASEPESLERDQAVGQLAAAEAAVKQGDGATALQRLTGIAKWTLDIATKIGTDVASKMIQSALGLGGQ
jgi:hypothetical protein